MKTPQPGTKMTQKEAREYVLHCLKTIQKHGKDKTTTEEEN